MVKRKPHHPLSGIKVTFADPDTLRITGAAVRSAVALGYDTSRIMGVVQSLATTDFIKSETAYNPPNPRVWHDSYRYWDGELQLYLKFAGETLVDVTLVSFKEA